MKLNVIKGQASKLAQIFIQDSSSSVGAGLTGLVFNTASLSAYYYREGAASATAITLATMTLGTWASGGFVVVDGTNLPGLYQLGIPDAALASGANSVVIMLKGASNMAPVVLEIQLVSFDPNDSVRMGLTALPNAAAGANGGLPTGNASGQVAVASIANNAITAAAIATDAIDNDAIAASAVTEIQAGLSTYAGGDTAGTTTLLSRLSAARAGYLDNLSAGAVALASSILDAAGIRSALGLASANLDTQLTTIDDFLDTEIAAIKAKTDNLPASPAAVGSAMTLSNAGIDAIFDRTDGVETGYTMRQALRLMAAALLGELSGAATTTITIRDIGDSKTRVTATVDSDGNRSGVVYDVS